MGKLPAITPVCPTNCERGPVKSVGLKCGNPRVGAGVLRPGEMPNHQVTVFQVQVWIFIASAQNPPAFFFFMQQQQLPINLSQLSHCP